MMNNQLTLDLDDIKQAVILGNGESRLGRDFRKEFPGAFVYGCNGAYRECPDALICTDVYMQHLIYSTGYCKEHLCYFSEWSLLPEIMIDQLISSTFGKIVANKRTGQRQGVVSGTEKYTYITWVDDKDMVKPIAELQMSSGSRALLSACESGRFKEIILCGFDGMGAKNVYHSTEGYERSTPREVWVEERQTIMDQFPEINFVRG